MSAGARLRRNLRDLPATLTLAAWLAGLLAVLIAYTGPLVLVFQAAQNAGLQPDHLASWIWALTVGSGVTTLALCLWFRQPIVIAWSVAGSALLVTGLQRYPYPAAVGAYLVAGVGAAVLGWSGWFGRLLALVPQPIVLGMLAGVLLRFGTGLFAALPTRPLLVGVMVLVFLVLHRLAFRAPTLGALAAGLLVAGLTKELHLGGFVLQVARPLWVWPTFSVDVLLGLALPLFVLAIASQDAPGVAVLQSAGYTPPVNSAVLVTGLASVVTAPFGGHGLNLAALMGAICASPEAHPDLDRRYGAGVTAAIWFMLFGAFGATAVALFAGFPPTLIAATAGLAMMPALLSSLTGALTDSEERLAAVFALLITAADIRLLGIGAPFWGLVLGAVTSRLVRRSARAWPMG